MGFMAGVKQFLGVGGVKIALAVPSQAQKSKQQLEGTVVLTAKSDQHIMELTVKLTESWTTGRGEDKTTKEFELGAIALPAPFDMRAGEVKEVPFTLPFTLLKSSNDQLIEKGGALGALGKVAAFAGAEKSTYCVKAEADVKGTALDPSDSKEIRLV